METKLSLKNKLFEEKGQIDNAVSSIITLVVGVGVAVLVLIFVGVLGGQTFEITESKIDSIGNNVVTGESGITANATSQLAHHDIQENTLSIFNTTGDQHQWALSNFTIDFTNGIVTSLPGGENGSVPINGTDLSANYTWGNIEIRNSIKSSIVSGFSALEQTGDFLPIIVLAVVIFLVLSLVLGFTAFGGGQGGGSAL